ncbi:hypothetical protein R3P38DRAFT_2756484 [Favolaschia claudopus]|uniref:Uncharacterized protein n=1 Tax=Favolaschia claudopus TaxID=2862362 RepID=A0AAW0EF47_9AGAR
MFLAFDSTRRTRRSYTKRAVDFLDSGIFQVVDSNFKLSFIGIQADFFLFHIESLICIHKTVSGTLYIKLSASIHLFEYRSTVSLQRSRMNSKSLLLSIPREFDGSQADSYTINRNYAGLVQGGWV